MQGRHLHFDCVSGIAGDMTLGALFDLGVPVQVVRDALDATGIGSKRLHVSPLVKAGIAATNVQVDTGVADHGLGHDHDHHHGEGHDHHHHHYADIRKRIRHSALDESLKTRVFAIFDRVAEAEAKLHGTTVEEVAFHEVGAIDSIVDVVGSAAALHWLAPTSVSASSIAMGKGQVRCAHGIIPVPSPAALEILRHVPATLNDGGLSIEMCTPTGAAILAASVTHWEGMPPMQIDLVGYGSGDFDLPDRPNVLRCVLGRRSQGKAASDSTDVVLKVEANIDDMSSELCEHVAQRLIAGGALDVWWSPITMKKGRPALLLNLLCMESTRSHLSEILFSESSTIGLRYQRMDREVLAREIATVETAYGPIRIKVSRRDERVVNAAPEYEDCRDLAQKLEVPLKEVFAAANAAWRAQSSEGLSARPLP